MSGNALQLPATLARQIVSHALAACPEEACGLVSGRDGAALQVHEGRNVSAIPRAAYELDSDTLALQIGFEEAGLALVAIYHSHPRGPVTPSAADIARAAYPGVVHIICSLADCDRPQLRGFFIAGERFCEIPLATTPG